MAMGLPPGALPSGGAFGDTTVKEGLPVRLTVPPQDEGSHRNYALQWFSFAGILLSLCSAALFILLLARRFLFGAEVQGVFTLFALQFFLTGIVLFGVGLMGEYIGRIQQEVRGRPRYRVKAVLERGDPAQLEAA